MSTVPSSAPSFFRSAIEFVEPPLTAARDIVASGAQFVATRIQDIWNMVQPYLASAAKFMSSQLGVSLELLGLSIIPLQLYRAVDNKFLSIALLAAGILIAGAGGFFLCSSGALPSFLTHVTPVTTV